MISNHQQQRTKNKNMGQKQTNSSSSSSIIGSASNSRSTCPAPFPLGRSSPHNHQPKQHLQKGVVAKQQQQQQQLERFPPLLIKQLPDELMEQILKFLDVTTMKNMRVVNRSFSNTIQYQVIAETNEIFYPEHDNQKDLYFRSCLQVKDPENIIGFHFSVKSRDQGWASVEGSYTWGEVSIMENETSMNEVSNEVRIFTGVPAQNQFRTYNKFIHKGEFKDFEKLSHSQQPLWMAIWARSCYACWMCYMGGAKIGVLYLE